MKRGRPKGRSTDNRSFGPLGDLIRKHRLSKKLGLLDVADACDCSVQFISNIEHGRAPLPWDKIQPMADCLGIAVDDLQAANFSMRSDFKAFLQSSGNGTRGKKVSTPAILATVTRAIKPLSNGQDSAQFDAAMQQIIQKYQLATPTARKKFVKAALQTLG